MVTDAEIAKFLHERAESMKEEVMRAHARLESARGTYNAADAHYSRLVNAQAQMRATANIMLMSASGERPL